MMEKPVGFDVEHQPAGAVVPARASHVAAMIVVSGCRAEHGEAPKAVLTRQVIGSRIQSAPIQGQLDCELVPATKRRVRLFVGADEIAIPPAQCTVARVKLVLHLGRRGDPDVRRQDGVQRAP